MISDTFFLGEGNRRHRLVTRLTMFFQIQAAALAGE